jgi:hypothetical protein
MTHLPTGNEAEYVNPFVVGRASSGRAKCGACKTLIPVQSLQMGATNTATPGSELFGRTFWKHMGCVSRGVIISVQMRLVTIAAAEGFGELCEADQALVLRVFAGDAAALAEVKEAQRVADAMAFWGCADKKELHKQLVRLREVANEADAALRDAGLTNRVGTKAEFQQFQAALKANKAKKAAKK